MRTAAIIPVKAFENAKTRLGLAPGATRELCRAMLEEIVSTVSASPRIDGTVIVTGEAEAAEIGAACGATVIRERGESGVNAAVALADARVMEEGYDASIVIPQDVPYLKVQDIDFVFGHAMHPSFAVIVPSQRFDGTNALLRMPVDLMGTCYDQDSYRAHMAEARRRTPNAATVFARRLMWDADTPADLEFLLAHPEKPALAARMRGILGR